MRNLQGNPASDLGPLAALRDLRSLSLCGMRKVKSSAALAELARARAPRPSRSSSASPLACAAEHMQLGRRAHSTNSESALPREDDVCRRVRSDVLGDSEAECGQVDAMEEMLAATE